MQHLPRYLIVLFLAPFLDAPPLTPDSLDCGPSPSGIDISPQGSGNSEIPPFVTRTQHLLVAQLDQQRNATEGIGRSPETVASLTLPYKNDCDQPDESWVPFLNYWRLKPEQWHWDSAKGTSNGCLRHEASLGVQEPKRGAHDAAILLRGGESWSDYVFEADAYAEKGHFGLWVRAGMQIEGSGNGRWVQGYYFVIDPAHRKWRLWRARLDGLVLRDEAGQPMRPEENHFSNPILLAEGATPDSVTHRRWLRLRVEVHAKAITASVDGQQLLSIQDDVYAAGSVGFTTYKGHDVRFDNVRVLP